MSLITRFWHGWLHRPQHVWLRRALFQVHLWSGLGIGLYVVVSCVSGSAVVFRNELAQKFSRAAIFVDASGPRLSNQELTARVLRTYPGADVTDVYQSKRATDAVEILLEREGNRIDELFDPYTGADLGAAEPPAARLLFWLVALHDDLLNGDTGRTINGVLGLILAVTCLTGAIIWWPGLGSWRRGLRIEWRANWKRMNWTLHSAIGFWAFVVVFGFAFTGVYLVFQEPFMAVVDYLEPAVSTPIGGRRRMRTGDLVLRWLARLHFGRFGWPYELLWVILGLIPPILFVTGALMWWNRVLEPAWRAARQADAPSALPVERPSEGDLLT